MNRFYRRSVLFTASLLVVLGFALLVATGYEGGGTVGYVVGCLFVALGAMRLYLLRRR